MTRQDEMLLKARRQRTRAAIDLAMAGKWHQAVTANQKIIDEYADEVDAFNRLGRAYMELGVYSRARVAYQRTLEHDAGNAIARRNLERLSQMGEDREVPEEETLKVAPDQFMEETGKTGTAVLERPAPPTVLARLDAGATLDLAVEGNRLKAFSRSEEYIGQLNPLDAHRLIKLIHGGNRYSATVTAVREGRVNVILREAFRHASQADVISFPPRGGDDISETADPLGLRNDSADFEE